MRQDRGDVLSLTVTISQPDGCSNKRMHHHAHLPCMQNAAQPIDTGWGSSMAVRVRHQLNHRRYVGVRIA